MWDKIAKELLPSVDVATDGSGDEPDPEHLQDDTLSAEDQALLKEKRMVESLMGAMYPVGSEEEDEIHGTVSQKWEDPLDPEIMALPAIGITKAIKRHLREAHQQEVVFWKAVVLRK